MYKFKKTTSRDILATRNEPFTEEEKSALPDMQPATSWRDVARAKFYADGRTVTKCPTKWAQGALRFSPGWDSTGSGAYGEQLYISNGEGVIGNNSANAKGRTVHADSDNFSR